MFKFLMTTVVLATTTGGAPSVTTSAALMSFNSLEACEATRTGMVGVKRVQIDGVFLTVRTGASARCFPDQPLDGRVQVVPQDYRDDPYRGIIPPDPYDPNYQCTHGRIPPGGC